MELEWNPRQSKTILKAVIRQLQAKKEVYRKGRTFFIGHCAANKHPKPCSYQPVGLFFEGSYFFGLMALWQLRTLNIPFFVFDGNNIQKNLHQDLPLLIIPGGWTGLKNEALKAQGRTNLVSYIRSGGNYLGICGGCGLGLSEKDGLGLVPCQRKKQREIANFHGEIKLLPTSDHPFWEGISPRAPFYVWWPALLNTNQSVKTIANYDEIGKDFYVSDINIWDIKKYGNISLWENTYSLRLEPEILKNQPAIIESAYGQGKVVLSYPHLDTPNNPWEELALFNLWQYLIPEGKITLEISLSPTLFPQKEALKLAKQLKKIIRAFLIFGQRHFLWQRLSPWRFIWRRGIRGFHYQSLYFMALELEKALKGLYPLAPENALPRLARLISDTKDFLEQGRVLVLKECLYLNRPKFNLLRSPDPQVNEMRKALFGTGPGFGGRLKEILKEIESLLLPLLQRQCVAK